MFPKRDATFKAIKSFLAREKQIAKANGKAFVSAKAQDSMVAMESHTEWKTANAAVMLHLNAKAKEPEVLEFCEDAMCQFVHNAPGQFNATQPCVLLKVPSTSEVESFLDVTVLVAPPGTKSINMTNKLTKQTPGWTIQKVGLAPETTLNLWKHGVKAKRKQCGLRHHMASTIHSAIGHTVTKMATQLGVNQDLWEKAMVVALVSRVSKARDLIFVGDKQANVNAILRGLCNETQCDDYVNHIVQILSQKEQTHKSSPVDLTINPFRPKDIPIPSDISGVACCLVSKHQKSVICPHWCDPGFKSTIETTQFRCWLKNFE